MSLQLFPAGSGERWLGCVHCSEQGWTVLLTEILQTRQDPKGYREEVGLANTGQSDSADLRAPGTCPLHGFLPAWQRRGFSSDLKDGNNMVPGENFSHTKIPGHPALCRTSQTPWAESRVCQKSVCKEEEEVC